MAPVPGTTIGGTLDSSQPNQSPTTPPYGRQRSGRPPSRSGGTRSGKARMRSANTRSAMGMSLLRKIWMRRMRADTPSKANEEILLRYSQVDIGVARPRPVQDRRRFHSAIDSSKAPPSSAPVASPAQLVTGTGLRTTMYSRPASKATAKAMLPASRVRTSSAHTA